MPTPSRRPGAADRGPLRLGPLDAAIPYYLRLAQVSSFAAFAERVGQGPLRSGWYSVLRVIGENPGVRATDVSRVVGRDKSTLTPVLRELERTGLIVRRQSAEDRRVWTLQLTAAGRRRLTELGRAAREHEREVDALVGAANKVKLIAMLQRIADGLGTRWARDRARFRAAGMRRDQP